MRKVSLNELLRRSEKFEEWKRAVFIRDRFTCQQCGARNGRKRIIEAHHLVEFSDLVKSSGVQTVDDGINCALLWDVANGQTLCHDCHTLTDSYPKNFRVEVKKNMTGRYGKTKFSEQL